MDKCPKCGAYLNNDEKVSGKCFTCNSNFNYLLEEDSGEKKYLIIQISIIFVFMAFLSIAGSIQEDHLVANNTNNNDLDIIHVTEKDSSTGAANSDYTPNDSKYSASDNYGKSALTDSEVKSLRGSGYHNTRPNSTAENIELGAAGNKCPKCGSHTRNGVNSLCSNCRLKE